MPEDTIISHHCKTTPFFLPMQIKKPLHNLSLLVLESSWESSDVVGQLALVPQELDICTIDQNLTSGLLLNILFTTERSEAPVLGNNDLLATRELVL